VACWCQPRHLSLHSPPTSATFKLAPLGRGLTLPDRKPWVGESAFQCKVEQLETVNCGPTRAPQSELSVWWGCAW